MPDASTRLARLSQTKIVATIGPACATQDQMVDLIEAGVDVFRLNMAHAGPSEQDVRLADIRSASVRAGRPVAVLVDLAGPKMRLGELPGGQLLCRMGDPVRFVRHASAAASPADGQPPELTTTYDPLINELAVGDRVMLADGTVSLKVEKVLPDAAECRVVQSGMIRSRQGVNLPGVKLSVAALSAVDRENAVWAAQNEIDYVGLSFVRKPEDVHELKAILASVVNQRADASPCDAPGGRKPGPQVIAKIEKPEALEHLEEIVEAADGVMVARGDLGVEIDIAQVAVVQKQIIAECNRRRKPVIIATQMLDSMQHSRLPTRAEVTDVSNAILDGADACMLSGETAVGEYPRESVDMMRRIALATEPLYRKPGTSGASPACVSPCTCDGLNPITEVTVSGAGRMAERLDARLIIVASASGATALSLAKNRCYVPTVGVSDSAATLRRMCLYWGVIPLLGAPMHDSRALVQFVIDWGRKAELLSPGDRIVLIAGTGLAVTAHNMVVVHEIGP